MERRRWDTDDRFTGIASGEALAPAVRQLLTHLGRDGWVTEDPDAHLLPHLRRACERPDSPWRLTGARLADDGVYVVDLQPLASTTEVAARELSVRDAVRLLATIAETSFFVRQVDETTVDCVTGMHDGDGPFATHGHLIRLRLAP
ncbi:hypothetical protein [Streptosporangium carneum]|uniref:Uncharacterized protein n=1 Tax=Streptosporangium carneum TaxID=47481 RepID=A0A9W6IAC6_9ACTN|nr:hypothetical protein [Streptosporangium carneum]GLK13790.1 hypothetical protein GCM10017600_72010 [Streptosporangium carneum]